MHITAHALSEKEIVRLRCTSIFNILCEKFSSPIGRFNSQLVCFVARRTTQNRGSSQNSVRRVFRNSEHLVVFSPVQSRSWPRSRFTLYDAAIDHERVWQNALTTWIFSQSPVSLKRCSNWCWNGSKLDWKPTDSVVVQSGWVLRLFTSQNLTYDSLTTHFTQPNMTFELSRVAMRKSCLRCAAWSISCMGQRQQWADWLIILTHKCSSI